MPRNGGKRGILPGNWCGACEANTHVPPDELDKVLVDSFETPIARPSEAQRQRRTYSGKKKRHTLKTQVVTDAKGRILEIDPGHRGPQEDIKLYEQSGLKHRYRRAKKQGDKAYCSQDHPELQTPHKKPKYCVLARKHLGGQLTPQQRQENRQQAQTRIYVEHGIRRIKAWRITREDYRLAVGLFPTIANVVVGLTQIASLVS